MATAVRRARILTAGDGGPPFYFPPLSPSPPPPPMRTRQHIPYVYDLCTRPRSSRVQKYRKSELIIVVYIYVLYYNIIYN